MQIDLWSVYPLMLKCRLFEEGIARIWYEGLISGEMHLGTGEEAIVAGIIPQLRDGDALALDHRGSAPLLLRGIDPVLLVREMLGRPDGLCRGMGGHMHLFSKEHLAASSGIVGASGPTAAGFGLAAQYLRPGSVVICFFGEGSMNQGMLMESMNLSAVWNLPVIFVCKDDGWSITTPSGKMTGGNLNERARGLGLTVLETDGMDVSAVWDAANTAITGARLGQGPTFLHTRCIHLEAHFLGYQMLRMIRSPFREMPGVALPMTRSSIRLRGAPLRERLTGLKTVMSAVFNTIRDPRRKPENDPLSRTRNKLLADPERLNTLEIQIQKEINEIFREALKAAKP